MLDGAWRESSEQPLCAAPVASAARRDAGVLVTAEEFAALERRVAELEQVVAGLMLAPVMAQVAKADLLKRSRDAMARLNASRT